MDVIKNLIARAQQNKQRIVLPEGTEERTLKAADKAIADGIAELVILGNREEILSLAQNFRLRPQNLNHQQCQCKRNHSEEHRLLEIPQYNLPFLFTKEPSGSHLLGPEPNLGHSK